MHIKRHLVSALLTQTAKRNLSNNTNKAINSAVPKRELQMFKEPPKAIVPVPQAESSNKKPEEENDEFDSEFWNTFFALYTLYFFINRNKLKCGSKSKSNDFNYPSY